MDSKSINLHQDLVDQCLAGSRSAQYELYKLYSKAMYNVCLRMLNDADDAEDALQEAFISAFNNLKSYRGEASFGSWLKRIVVNKCINFIKKSRAFMVPLEEQHEETVQEEERDQKVTDYQVEGVKRAISELPDGFRSVLTLYLFEGYDHKEIAEILGVTESTSKSQYMRAKKKLKDIIETRYNYG